jgi:3-phenylpropionate/cinnamic acid dioxygenase small subunit
MMDDTAEVERFLVDEARLLDEGRYEAWLDLFTANGWYWVPLARDQASPFDTISLMYDDRRLLETRVRRLGNPNMHAQLPASRTSRIVANVTVEESAPGFCVVRSKLMMLEYRADNQRMFAGTCRHKLIRDGGGFRIAWKRVDLINSEGILDGLVVPF